MTQTTSYYASIDSNDPVTGTVYGVGRTERGAIQSARLSGQIEPGQKPNFAIVQCSPAAYRYIRKNGGAPDTELEISLREGVFAHLPYGVWLRSEEE